jgi:hypothetical protein
MEKVTAAMLLCACGGVGGLTSEDVYGLSPQPRVWLSGIVTNVRSGEVVAGATVQIEGVSTLTDMTGAYRLDNLPVSTNALGSATADGFEPYALALNLRAGANLRDLGLQPLACGPYRCASDQLCDDANGQCISAAILSGTVVSACDRTAISARVTIDGKSTCSTASSGKAYFQLTGLMPGGPQTLSAGKTGYQAFSSTLTLQAGFNAAGPIELTPVGGCGGTVQDEPCTCTQSYCQ